MSELTELTEKLWKVYFTEDEEGILGLLQMFQENSSVIGTGRHEFYRNLQEFTQGIIQELQERQHIRFQFKELQCEELEVNGDCSLVYGSVKIRGENMHKTVQINMDSRFSILYKRENGRWRILHIHQSVPNSEQMYGEYFPKTLVDQVESANQKIRSLTKLAEVDALTGLMNIRTLREKYRRFPKKDTWLFVLDIDDFKDINDQYGHLQGNQVLITLSDILVSASRENDLVCRMGGDEFILLCTDIKTEQGARHLTERLMTKIETREKGEVPSFGVSVGLTQVREEETFENAFRRADHALYHSKRNGKGKISVQY